MAQYTEPFTGGLSRTLITYITDSGSAFNASTRIGYTVGGLDGFTAGAQGVANLPTRFKMRQLHLVSVGVTATGKRVRRSIPCSVDVLSTYFQQALGQGGNIFVVNVDGLDFYIASYTGEYLHKTRG